MAYRHHNSAPIQNGFDLFEFAEIQAETSNSKEMTAGLTAGLTARLNHKRYAETLIQVASHLLSHAVQYELNTEAVSKAMTLAFGGTDAEGRWTWSDAYDAIEIAKVQVFIQGMRRGPVSRKTAQILMKSAGGLHLSQTRRSDEKINWQQFSTPQDLAAIVGMAAQLDKSDLVLEPSAGTGMLLQFPILKGCRMVLNEMEPRRYACLKEMFPNAVVSRHNGEYLDDLLDEAIRPSVVLMNPPFSASPNMGSHRRSLVTELHIRQALQRLRPKGRLVAITGSNFEPRVHADAIERLQEIGRVVFSMEIAGSVYRSHGTSFPTRLTVIDKVPAEHPRDFKAYNLRYVATDPDELRNAVTAFVPRRQELATVKIGTVQTGTSSPSEARPVEAQPQEAQPQALQEDICSEDKLEESSEEDEEPDARNSLLLKGALKGKPLEGEPLEAMPLRGEPLIYEPVASLGVAEEMSEGLYEVYRPQSVLIEEAQPHPTALVQSSAMASVAPPQPSYIPMLPRHLARNGVLSEAQLESVIYAGEAHSKILEGTHRIDERHEFANAGSPNPDAIKDVQFRQGWFLGDGTGCGKGRQVAAVILDNWLQGRRKAIWISKNDKLLEDARRDWEALGGNPKQVVPLASFSQGQEITLSEGILFVTYGTLRTPANGDKQSRLDQIIDWCVPNFDGVLAFDEAHALANCAAVRSEGGRTKAASKQGEAGLKLQRGLPEARVMYVSATGATSVENLAYAERLGLWGEGTAFATRSAFISQIEAGGVAAMEVVSRDLKALGLYTARSLSYEGIEVDMLEHSLTDAQTEIYNTYCRAYQKIHASVERVLAATNVIGGDGKSLNRHAASVAKSRFESLKQRFFNHLLTAMKCQTLIPAIEADLERGDAVVVQVVSTGESLLNKRLADIPTEEWGDISVDVTPREYILEYLTEAFPVQLHEIRMTETGRMESIPVYDSEGRPVQNKAAIAERDALIERIASLPAVPSALDQVLQHFGADAVAEITGRKLRLIREDGRLVVNSRPASSNTSETHAFMNDEKRILVFSNAGGTGRSYHADLGCKNQRRRVHYLLEAGWQADNAIQGLGRSNRTNQAHPPLFRPVATNVKGEKRFLSTIARRLDTLGAMTKGQRQTGGQGMFRPEDNLESIAARKAIVALLRLIAQNKLGQNSGTFSLKMFSEQTGLKLFHESGEENFPETATLMNRMLALDIGTQNMLFEAFERILEGVVDGLKAAGKYDEGVETLKAKSFRVLETRELSSSMSNGKTAATTRCVEIERTEDVSITDPDETLAYYEGKTTFMVNAQSGRAAICIPAPSRMNEEGEVQPCVALIRPTTRDKMRLAELEQSNWQEVLDPEFRAVWTKEVAGTERVRTSRLFLVTGLLLPIWTKLGTSDPRVNRLRTDDGEALLGRLISEADLPEIYAGLGLNTDAIPTETLWTAVQEGRPLQLTGGLRVIRRRVAGATRIAIDHEMGPDVFERLIALGCFTETHQFKRVAFISTGAEGQAVLERLIDAYPIQSRPESSETGGASLRIAA